MSYPQSFINHSGVFTTNYDLFLEKAFDLYLEKNNRISLNDGSEGYFRRYIDSDNYNKTTAHSGMYDNYYMETPTFNLIKLHGSANWELDDNNKILINNDLGYFENFKKIAHKILNANFIDYNEEEQSNYINNLICDIENCLNLEILEDEENLFSSIEIDKIHLNKMNKLQIIIPTKEKLKNTVFSNHYLDLRQYLGHIFRESFFETNPLSRMSSFPPNIKWRTVFDIRRRR
ncbi:hypothetical protein C7H83_12130 [Tetragenococcus halophilus]|uniref:Uncharacterized protein n=1 Tax=Tetragenococcus halophilus TaxID=51669 RepID=A0A3G5FLB9_TETHA|nr:SIR2 family protein [Tetragenococcus halophilus]AYW51156.1 hypothetical protein C7H83_12130 [Tetragenococcus halophilus]GBD64826.1 hypothetical protein TEHD23766T_2253 [Tetragenococcus halophilus subsp. flandriensis]